MARARWGRRLAGYRELYIDNYACARLQCNISIFPSFFPSITPYILPSRHSHPPLSTHHPLYNPPPNKHTQWNSMKELEAEASMVVRRRIAKGGGPGEEEGRCCVMRRHWSRLCHHLVSVTDTALPSPSPSLPQNPTQPSHPHHPPATPPLGHPLLCLARRRKSRKWNFVLESSLSFGCLCVL